MQRCSVASPICFALALACVPVHAQSLKDALDGAWSRQPAARATAARMDELAAKRNAADALFPEPPSVNLGYRTDQANQNYGVRELEGLLRKRGQAGAADELRARYIEPLLRADPKTLDEARRAKRQDIIDTERKEARQAVR